MESPSTAPKVAGPDEGTVLFDETAAAEREASLWEAYQEHHKAARAEKEEKAGWRKSLADTLTQAPKKNREVERQKYKAWEQELEKNRLGREQYWKKRLEGVRLVTDGDEEEKGRLYHFKGDGSDGIPTLSTADLPPLRRINEIAGTDDFERHRINIDTDKTARVENVWFG